MFSVYIPNKARFFKLRSFNLVGLLLLFFLNQNGDVKNIPFKLAFDTHILSFD